MAVERPLSPHLQIYRPQITSVLSVLHRGTGIVLTLGLFILAWWLVAGAAGPEAYQHFRDVVSHPLGIIVMIGFSYALFYHTCTGIRHLMMDAGKLFTIPEIYKGGYTAVIASLVLTTVFWLAIIFRG